MTRQGLDLQLTRYGDEGWRATFYPAGWGTPSRRRSGPLGSGVADGGAAAACERAFASARPSEPAYEPLVVTPSVRVLKAMGD
jgi:hypothetical protein